MPPLSMKTTTMMMVVMMRTMRLVTFVSVLLRTAHQSFLAQTPPADLPAGFGFRRQSWPQQVYRCGGGLLCGQ
jgi:hypothetical protein